MNDFKFKLNNNTLVCIDWANVYGWQKKLGWKIDVFKLVKYLKNYSEVNKIRFYFGTDTVVESQNFIASTKKIEDKIFGVVTKDVKYVPVDVIDSNGKHKKERRRKCDFDIEIALDVFLNIDVMETLILFSGDGDYEPLVKFCIEKGKKVIIVANPGSLGKEYRLINKGLFVCNIKKLKEFVEKTNSRGIAPPGVI